MSQILRMWHEGDSRNLTCTVSGTFFFGDRYSTLTQKRLDLSGASQAGVPFLRSWCRFGQVVTLFLELHLFVDVQMSTFGMR